MPNPTNLVMLHGTLSSDPRSRTLPSGDELIAYEVTTDIGDERLSVPVVWFSPRRTPALAAGHDVVALGAVRRRFYRAGGASASRTEVVAEVVARSGTRSADRAVDAVRSVLASTTEIAAGRAGAEGSPQQRPAR